MTKKYDDKMIERLRRADAEAERDRLKADLATAQATIERMDAALEPFADKIDKWEAAAERFGDDFSLIPDDALRPVTVGQLRGARAARKETT